MLHFSNIVRELPRWGWFLGLNTKVDYKIYYLSHPFCNPTEIEAPILVHAFRSVRSLSQDWSTSTRHKLSLHRYKQ